MEQKDLTYPVEGEDLKWRVTGEVLRTLEQRSAMPPAEEVVSIIEALCLKITEEMKRRKTPLRQIDLEKRVGDYLHQKSADSRCPGEKP